MIKQLVPIALWISILSGCGLIGNAIDKAKDKAERRRTQHEVVLPFNATLTPLEDSVIYGEKAHFKLEIHLPAGTEAYDDPAKTVFSTGDDDSHFGEQAMSMPLIDVVWDSRTTATVTAISTKKDVAFPFIDVGLYVSHCERESIVAKGETPACTSMFVFSLGPRWYEAAPDRLIAGPLLQTPLGVGETRAMQFAVPAAKGSSKTCEVEQRPGGVTYTVEDPSIAKVDENGAVTGLKPGTTRLIATLGELAPLSRELTVIHTALGPPTHNVEPMLDPDSGWTWETTSELYAASTGWQALAFDPQGYPSLVLRGGNMGCDSPLWLFSWSGSGFGVEQVSGANNAPAGASLAFGPDGREVLVWADKGLTAHMNRDIGDGGIVALDRPQGVAAGGWRKRVLSPYLQPNAPRSGKLTSGLWWPAIAPHPTDGVWVSYRARLAHVTAADDIEYTDIFGDPAQWDAYFGVPETPIDIAANEWATSIGPQIEGTDAPILALLPGHYFSHYMGRWRELPSVGPYAPLLAAWSPGIPVHEFWWSNVPSTGRWIGAAATSGDYWVSTTGTMLWDRHTARGESWPATSPACQHFLHETSARPEKLDVIWTAYGSRTGHVGALLWLDPDTGKTQTRYNATPALYLANLDAEPHAGPTDTVHTARTTDLDFTTKYANPDPSWESFGLDDGHFAMLWGNVLGIVDAQGDTVRKAWPLRPSDGVSMLASGEQRIIRSDGTDLLIFIVGDSSLSAYRSNAPDHDYTAIGHFTWPKTYTTAPNHIVDAVQLDDGRWLVARLLYSGLVDEALGILDPEAGTFTPLTGLPQDTSASSARLALWPDGEGGVYFVGQWGSNTLHYTHWNGASWAAWQSVPYASSWDELRHGGAIGDTLFAPNGTGLLVIDAPTATLLPTPAFPTTSPSRSRFLRLADGRGAWVTTAPTAEDTRVRKIQVYTFDPTDGWSGPVLAYPQGGAAQQLWNAAADPTGGLWLHWGDTMSTCLVDPLADFSGIMMLKHMDLP